MSFDKLSEQLKETAELLKAHLQNERLHDTAFIKEAEKLTKTLSKFEKQLKAIAAGESPQAKALETLMEQCFQDITEAAVFSKKVLSKKTKLSKNDDLPTYRQKVFEDIVTNNKTDYASVLLRKMTAASVLEFNNTDELSLLQQIRKLGSLDDDQLEIEAARLIKNKKLLFNLADASKIRYKPENKPETIVRKLIAEGRRYYENTGLFNG